jgi:hypothetical protein
VTSVAVDNRDSVWVGTEGSGLWSGSPSASGYSWLNYSSSTSGMGDKVVTSLLCDSEGRVWAGTLNHGVSVFNGRIWKNYNSLIGPLGSHVFALAENPLDHSVWIGTENGLSRYDQTTGVWSYWNKSDGLPSNQVSAIGFDSAGNICVGTQCDGIGLANASDGYKSWRTVSGPISPTHASAGVGLPSCVINAIAVASRGTIYIGTDWGLAESLDSGASWRYIRGDDWREKAEDEFPPARDKLVNMGNATLLSDYVTSLCLDTDGNLWVGHRDYGAEVFETTAFQRTGQTSTSAGDYITCMLPSNIGVLFGTYGHGISVLSTDTSLTKAGLQPNATSLPTFPTPAEPPTTADLQALVTRVLLSSRRMAPGDAAYLDDDWDTQGNWLAHYGKQCDVVCDNHGWGGDNFGVDPRVSLNLFLGPNDKSNDYIAEWTGAVQQPDNRSSLYDPNQGIRDVYSWNDNGEAYASTDSGGDLWYSVNVPEGIFRLSTYFFNDDGDNGSNRYRDYLLEIRAHITDNAQVTTTDKPIALARVVNFRTAVYKSFVICGPAVYDVRVNRNGSINGMLSAIFVDKLAGKPDPSDELPLPCLHGADYESPKIEVTTDNTAGSLISSAMALLSALDSAYADRECASLQEPFRLLAYRAINASSADDGTLEAMRWQTHVWTDQDNIKFEILTAKAFAAKPAEH